MSALNDGFDLRHNRATNARNSVHCQPLPSAHNVVGMLGQKAVRGVLVYRGTERRDVFSRQSWRERLGCRFGLVVTRWPRSTSDPVKGKGLDTCYSAAYMSQTRDQQRFTISEVAADWHEPMVPHRIMWPSIARANGQLDPRCS